MLEEMGLGPVWRLRARTSGCGVATPASPGEESSGGEAPAWWPAEPEGAGPALVDRVARIACMDWPALKEAVMACTACGLCKTRKNAVFGVGDEHAEWLLVGEAPGAEEDARGEPFVGQAGRLLDNMLAAIDLARGEGVYIANVLKCRPPGNRNPEPGEIAQCSPHLTRQVALIRPKLIVAMGRFAAQTLLATEASIASLRGRRFEYQGVPLVVTYHPAYLLRNLPDKAKAWEDLVFARATLRDLPSGASPRS
ncbi:MAG: uracil-DNA glycosylase [Burkholderiales bacterium]|nr:uracil-DNA glycosylase [Burkholderiales bacterium]